jgi:hypothetical protein
MPQFYDRIGIEISICRPHLGTNRRHVKVINIVIIATAVECEEQIVSLIILSKLSLDRENSLSI